MAVGIIDQGDGYKLQTIQGINNQPVQGNVLFNAHVGSNILKEYEDFSTGRSEMLIIKAEDVVNFRIELGDLKLFDEDDIDQISINRVPVMVPFDLAFTGQDLEVRNLTAELYYARLAKKIKTRIYSLYSETQINTTDEGDLGINWNISHEPCGQTINEEIAAYQIIQYIYSQHPITIYLRGNGPLVFQCPVRREDYVQDAIARIAYLNDLKKVERALSLRFTNISNINDDSFSNLTTLIKIINGEKFPMETDLDITFDEISPDMLVNIEKINEGNCPFEVTMNGNATIFLHGHTIKIPGVHIEVPDAEITNLEALKSNEDKILKVKSKGGTIYHTYHFTPFPNHE